MTSDSAKLSEEPVTVVFATDDGYAPYLLVALASVLRCGASGRPYQIVILDKGISEYWRSRLEDVTAKYGEASLHFLRVEHLDATLDAIFARRGKKGKVTKWSYAAYYRLFLASLLPDCHRAVYLDVDTLVCDDLALLHDMEMQGCAVACAADVCLCHDTALSETRSTLASCGHDMTRYFNSGVLVINLDCWRATPDFEEKIAEKLYALPHLVYPDQDALNVLFCNNRIDLDVRWNFLTPQMDASLDDEAARARRDVVAATRDFGIIHYAGLKPWRSPETVPFASLWWECARYAGVDGDIILHESALLRSYLKARQEAGRLNSLRLQALCLRLQCLLSPPRRRERLYGKLARVRRKLQTARVCRSRRI